jgi:hypothetical protein
VVVRTTSPVEIWRCRQSSIAQTRTPAVTMKTEKAWNNRSRSSERRLSRCADISRSILCDRRSCSRLAAPNARTRLMLLTTSVMSPLTAAARPAKRACRSWPLAANFAMIVARIATIMSSTAVICQLMVLSNAMLLSTAVPGGIVVQVREFSMVQAVLAAVEIRPASAPGNWSAK